jgi:hypothetical protein
MDFDDLVHWLLDNAGPSIRYRVIDELLNEQDIGIVGKALKDLMDSSNIVLWLNRLTPDFSLNGIHSSNPSAFENVMGKLVMLGLRAGLIQFDNSTIPFRTWLSDSLAEKLEFPHAVFQQTIIASFLAYARYGRIQPVVDHLTSRLNALNKFAENPDFQSIFVDKSEYKGIPKSAKAHQLVNPEFYPEQQFILPWIHDIRGLAFCDTIMENTSLKKKCESVVKLILTEEYQNLPWSYGIARYYEKYYVIGWAVNLPGFHSEIDKTNFGELLLNLEMMAVFESARNSDWFSKSIHFLEEFKTDRGTYLFPRSWLPERKVGYWVGGLRMGLESERMSQLAIECESTFWMLHIKHLAEMN